MTKAEAIERIKQRAMEIAVDAQDILFKGTAEDVDTFVEFLEDTQLGLDRLKKELSEAEKLVEWSRSITAIVGKV
jgi:hypothetical protein